MSRILKEKEILKINDYIWISVETIEGKKLVKVGLTEYFKGNMNPIEFIRVLPEGRYVARGHPFGSIESGRKIMLLRAPFTGIVVKVNEAVREDPTLINKDPYGNGWIVLLEPLKFDEEVKEI